MNKTKICIGTVMSIIALAILPQASAFKPDQEGYGHTLITRSLLNSGYSYGGDTAPAFSVTLSDSTNASFTAAAANTVVTGNQSTDWIFSHDITEGGVTVPAFGGYLDSPEAHCDNDLVGACSARIERLRSEITNHIGAYMASLAANPDSPDKVQAVTARAKLGTALHTVQDFYAHSDFANSHPGAAQFDALFTPESAAAAVDLTKATCLERHEATFSLLSWDNNGGNWSLVSHPDSQVTSGYFYTSDVLASFGSAPDSPVARCDHGVRPPFGTVSGINKDEPVAPFAPGPYIPATGPAVSPLHVLASYQAALASTKLLNLVVQDLIASASDATDADNRIKVLLGLDVGAPVVGFVIDTTGSMGDIISGVQTQTQDLIAQRNSSAPGTKFLLETFNDPTYGTPVIGDAPTISAAVGALVAEGGGDCPELANSGILAAVKAAPPKSTLFVFTDASSKDGSLEPQSEAIATSKGITVNYALSGSCSPIDPTFYKLAAATGGVVIITEHSAAAVAAAFSSITIQSSGIVLEPVLIRSGTVAAQTDIPFPVESGASTLSILANLPSGTVTLLDPTGTAITNGGNNVISTFIGGTGFRVTSPAQGSWTLRLAPDSSQAYSVQVNAASALDFYSVDFAHADAGGRAGHEVYMPYSAPPPVGNVLAKAQVNGGVQTLSSLALVAADGTSLTSATPSMQSATAFWTPITIPANQFYVVVTGNDSSGQPFMRTFPTPYQGRALFVERIATPTLYRNAANVLRYRVFNQGATANVAFSTTPSAGTVASVVPASAVVMSGTYQDVDVTLDLSAADATDQQVSVATTALTDSLSDTDQTQLDLAVDTDGDGVPDFMEKGLAQTDAAYDGNGDSIPDYKQASVATLQSYGSEAYVTISTATGALANVGSMLLPESASTAEAQSLSANLFSFTVTGVPSGGTAQVSFYLPSYLAVQGFSFFGPDAANPTPHVIPATGVSVKGSVVTLTLTDGGAGDLDGKADGQIHVLGGPADINGVGAKSVASQPVTARSGGSFSWLMLLVLGVAYAIRRKQALAGLLVGLLALGLTGFAPQARADGFDLSKAYVGVRLGESRATSAAAFIKDVNADGYSVQGSADGRSLGGSLYVGYDLFHGLGLEAGYLRIGRIKAELTGNSAGAPAEQDAAERLKGGGNAAELLGRYHYDLYRGLYIDPRAGFYVWHSQQDVGSASASDTGVGLTAGVGLSYAVWRGLEIGAGFDLFRSGRDALYRQVNGQLEWRFGQR